MFNIVCFLSNLVTGASVSFADTRNHILRGIPELAGKAYILMLFICFSKVHIKINQVAEIQKPYGCKGSRKKKSVQGRQHKPTFLFARVSYREKLFSKFADACTFLSCDNTNKVKMGPSPAFSRYHQQHWLSMSNNCPNLGDNDFPNPGYTIVFSGCQPFVLKENVCEEEEYWATNLNNINDDEALTNVDLLLSMLLAILFVVNFCVFFRLPG